MILDGSYYYSASTWLHNVLILPGNCVEFSLKQPHLRPGSAQQSLWLQVSSGWLWQSHIGEWIPCVILSLSKPCSSISLRLMPATRVWYDLNRSWPIWVACAVPIWWRRSSICQVIYASITFTLDYIKTKYVSHQMTKTWRTWAALRRPSTLIIPCSLKDLPIWTAVDRSPGFGIIFTHRVSSLSTIII